MRTSLSAVLCVALASCGASDRATDPRGEGAADKATVAGFSLASAAFRPGQPIPTEFTCDGADRSPALSWDEPPQGTRSFALVVDDPDAPSGTFRHWGAYDIPASARSIGAGQTLGTPAINDMGKPGYGGPCPPKGHGSHHYHFKLFALDTGRLDLPSGARIADVEAAASEHQIARAELTGTYERE